MRHCREEETGDMALGDRHILSCHRMAWCIPVICFFVISIVRTDWFDNVDFGL